MTTTRTECLTAAGIDEAALVRIDARIAKAEAQFASACNANRGLHQSMRQITLRGKISDLNAQRGEIVKGHLVIFARGTYRILPR